MIYLSQVINVPIIDDKQDVIGRVADIVVKESGNNGYPEVSGVVYRRRGKIYMIPYQFIENFGFGEVTLRRSNCGKSDYEFSKSEFFLSRDVLDQQIFDIGGIRVVRVNDLELAKIKSKFALVGIDVSNRGLLRRLGLSGLPFIRRAKSKLIDWNNVSLVAGPAGSLQLKTSRDKLQKLHPADIANLIESLNFKESTKLVQSFDEETAAEVLGEVAPQYKDALIEHINPKNLAYILEEMPSDEAANVIQDLSDTKKSQVYRRLGVRKAEALHKLSQYDRNIAGSMMNSEFMHVSEDASVMQAINKIKKESEEHGSIYHVFVIDTDGKLVGIVSVRTLLLSNNRKKVGEIMSRVYKTVRVRTKIDDVARLMTKYNLMSIAVVDKNRIMKGIITVDDILRFLLPEA